MVLKNEVSQKANIIYLPSCLQSSAPLTNITVSFYYKQRYNQDIYHNPSYLDNKKHNPAFNRIQMYNLILDNRDYRG